MTKPCFCKSYYDDDNKLQDCTCGECKPNVSSVEGAVSKIEDELKSLLFEHKDSGDSSRIDNVLEEAESQLTIHGRRERERGKKDERKRRDKKLLEIIEKYDSESAIALIELRCL